MKTWLILGLAASLWGCAPRKRETHVLPSPTGVVQANGMALAYERFGFSNKETILLIAGTNSQLTAWPTSFCRYLAQRGYQVIRFDNRDVGLSTKLVQAGPPDWAAIGQALQANQAPALPYTLDDMATDAAELLTALGIDQAHVVGASMGGMIAQRLAYNHPSRVLTLTSIMAGGGKTGLPLIAKPEALAAVPAPGPPTDTASHIRREMLLLRTLNGTAYTRDSLYLQAMVRADVRRSYYPEGMSRQGAASLAGFYAGREPQLRTIRVPTLVLHGSADPLVTPEAGRDVARNVPNARFVLIEGMGHGISPAFATQVADLILSNVDK